MLWHPHNLTTQYATVGESERFMGAVDRLPMERVFRKS